MLNLVLNLMLARRRGRCSLRGERRSLREERCRLEKGGARLEKRGARFGIGARGGGVVSRVLLALVIHTSCSWHAA